MMHGVSGIRVLVVREKRARLLPVQERRQGLPVPGGFRDKAATIRAMTIRAKARPGLLASLNQSHVTIFISMSM